MYEGTRYKCQMSGCPIVSTIEAPVCEEHLAQIGRIFLETRSVAGSFLQLRNDVRRKQDAALAEARVEASAPHPTDSAQPFANSVYYVRIGSHVKIGTTVDLRRRLRSFYVDHDPDLLLALEPGDGRVEAARHAQFRDERVYVNRELFNPSRRLLAHIDALNEAHHDARMMASTLMRSIAS